MLRIAIVSVLLIGCDGGSSTPVDAPNILIDSPADAAGPDAFVCTTPSKMCGTECLDVSTDETNCGDCGIACKGGEYCATTCMCPDPFVPATIDSSSFDQFQAAGTITIAISPNIGGAGINPVLFGYDGGIQLDHPYDLAVVGLGALPFAAAAYGFNLSNMQTDANYAVTAGTLTFTKACATEAQGTLTNATFQGVSGGLMNPMIDPMGCSFTVASLAFHMMTSPCP